LQYEITFVENRNENHFRRAEPYYTLRTGNIMIQKKEFSNIHKQIVLSNQKHKCEKCGIKFNVAHLPNFGYADGNITNNARTNLQILCSECSSQGTKP